jgi:hypothetical protein
VKSKKSFSQWLVPSLVVVAVAAVGAYTLHLSSAQDKLPAPKHIWWGSWVRPGTTLSNPTIKGGKITYAGEHFAALQQQEALIGRKFDVDHAYFGFGQTDDIAKAMTLVNTDESAGRHPLISFSAHKKGSAEGQWAKIASGAYDKSFLLPLATALKTKVPQDKTIWFAWQHEPSTPQQGGTPAQFVAAWRHVHDYLQAQGVKNLRYTLILTAQNFRNDYNGSNSPWKASALFPGTQYVDVLGSDGYNWDCTNGRPCSPGAWTSFASVFGATEKFAESKNLPWWATEVGVAEAGWSGANNNGNMKAQWLQGMLSTAKTMPNLHAIVYYQGGVGNPGNIAHYNIGSSQAALNAYKAVGHDDFFNQ